jgi:hypothetical protein
MADGKDTTNDHGDKRDDGSHKSQGDASQRLFSDAQPAPPAPAKPGDQVTPVGDQTVATNAGDRTVATTTDYSQESDTVQARMAVPPAEGLRVAQENVANLTASISNSPEGLLAAKTGLTESIKFFASRNPQISEYFQT